MSDTSTMDPERTARSTRWGMGCVTLFALPFVAVGAFAAVELVRGLTGGTPSAMPPGFAAIFALAFGGAGIGIIAAARYGAKKAVAEAASRAERPDEPWLWRDDWAEGRARSPQRAGATAMIAFAFMWNVISAPVLFILPDEVSGGNTAALFGLLFPLVGVGLIIAAARLYIRSRKYRGTEVELGALPIVPGATFEGTLHARFGHGAPEVLSLTLSCIRRRVTGSGKNRNTSERVLWQEEQRVEGWDIAVDFEEARVPFAFEIPDAAPTTTPGSGDDRILWRLDAHAATPGVDYAESFELPVFTPDHVRFTVPSSDAFEEMESRLAAGDPDAPPVRPVSPTIVIRPADPAGTEFISSPNSGRASVWPITLFLLIFWGATIFMWRADAPFLFPVVFGIFGMLLLYGAVDLAFGTTRTLVAADGVTVRTQALGMGKTRHIPLGDVRLVGVKVGMSQGTTATQSAKAWHQVEIRRADGGGVTAARHIPTRGEAEWVAAELRRAIGLD